MDRWGWSRKKRSSEKTVAVADPAEPSVAQSESHNDEQDAIKTLADHARRSESAMIQLQESKEKVKNLNEKLSAAMSEISTKESLVKQHAKVAEDAVSGWEKAQKEALDSKQQVESLMQQKVALEERATHLDGALKECMRQLRHVREEQEHKIHEVVVNKTRECDKIRFEFEAKLAVLDQQLLQESAENTALSRSLQECSRTLAELNEARSQAEAEVKVLEVNIESYQNESSSLKYELHMLSKELEIRNEERNMSMKSADAATKQHLETVKKIAKLEAECQRLRGLLRKKLPGPAALAQMKMEVETWGKESVEGRKRRSPGKGPGLFLSPPYDSGYDDSQEQGQKESEFLTERLLAMEEETKMLKEALSKRNTDLQASRMMCARTASKLSTLEKQLEALNNGQKPKKPALELHVEGPRGQTTSNPPSLTSVSEDGNDDEISCAESWASALISELSHIQKEKSSGTSNKVLESRNMDLMDDFTEIEKLASMPSPKIDQTIGKLDDSSEKGVLGIEDNTSLDESLAKRDSELQSANQQCLDLSKMLASVQEELTELQAKNVATENSLVSLQARLDMIFEAQAEGRDMQKVLQDVQCAMAEEGEALSASHVCNRKLSEEPLPLHELDNQELAFQFTKSLTTEEEGIFLSDTKVGIDGTDPKLESTVCRVVTLVESIANEARSSQNFPAPKLHDLDVSIEMFTKSINQTLHGKTDIIEFVTELSSVLIKLSEISAPAFGKCDGHNESNGSGTTTPEIKKTNYFENGNLDPSSFRENTASSTPSMPSYTCSPNADSELSVIQEEKSALESEVKAIASRSPGGLQEELTQSKAEKDELDSELMASKEKLTRTKYQLTEAEDMLMNLQGQLASAQESNKIAENQLEIMTSSKADLELQLKAAEVQINHLHEKVEALESELQEEHKHYVDAEAKCQGLQEQLQRKEEELASLQSSISDNDSNMRQKREIEAAAEKIAECQKTILNVGRQLNALSSPKDSVDWLSDRENVLFTSTSCGLMSQNELHDAKHSRHHIEDLSKFTSQRSGRNGKIEQGASPNSHHGSTASETDIQVSGNDKQKTNECTSASSGSTAIVLYKNNESASPVHEDYTEGQLTMPSSSDTEPRSPNMSLVKSTHRKNKIPRSLAVNALSKSLNADEGKSSSSVSSSEKHGSGLSRFFSRTRASH